MLNTAHGRGIEAELLEMVFTVYSTPEPALHPRSLACDQGNTGDASMRFREHHNRPRASEPRVVERASPPIERSSTFHSFKDSRELFPCFLLGRLVIVTVLFALIAVSWNLHQQMSGHAEAIFRLQREHVGRRDFASRFDGASNLLSLTSPNTSTAEHLPHIVLDGILKPGHCWSFVGSQGQIGIQLTESISVSHITIDHAPKELVANLDNAPRTMRIWGASKDILHNNGCQSDGKEKGPRIRDLAYSFAHLGTVHYDISASEHIQTYFLPPLSQGIAMPFQAVVVEFVDNWGGESTCIYRVRIHGDPVRGIQKHTPETFV